MFLVSFVCCLVQIIIITASVAMELELELIQTHMTQKPMLRVEVGALGAHQVKNIRGVVGQARMCKAPVWVDVGISAPAGLLTFFFEMDTVHVFSWWWALWCH